MLSPKKGSRAKVSLTLELAFVLFFKKPALSYVQVFLGLYLIYSTCMNTNAS